jgi:uncharacterized protein YidB (DUF937 family)
MLWVCLIFSVGHDPEAALTLALMGVLAYRTMKGKGRLADMTGSATTGAGNPGGLLSGGAGGGMLTSGLQDLLAPFGLNGHGEMAQSWVSAGPNQPIAPHEVEQALGEDRVQWLMQQTGMSKADLLAGLSRELPQTVDKLTPNGRVPTEEEASHLVKSENNGY